jgi:hypothetical protein
MSTSQSPIRILDAHVPLEQPAEAQGPEVDVPDAVVDLLEADWPTQTVETLTQR